MGLLDYKCASCEIKIKKSFFNNGNAFVLSPKTGKIYKSMKQYLKKETIDENYKVFCKSCIEGELEKKKELEKMIITTTSSIQGKNILDYKGIVTSQVFMGVNLFKDIASGFRDLVGGRSKAIEGEFNVAKDILLVELKRECLKLKANAIIGMKIDFEDIGKASGNAFMLLGMGTAVVME